MSTLTADGSLVGSTGTTAEDSDKIPRTGTDDLIVAVARADHHDTMVESLQGACSVGPPTSCRSLVILSAARRDLGTCRDRRIVALVLDRPSARVECFPGSASVLDHAPVQPPRRGRPPNRLTARPLDQGRASGRFISVDFLTSLCPRVRVANGTTVALRRSLALLLARGPAVYGPP